LKSNYASLHVSAVDWIIVGVVALLALMGFGQGLIASALSLAGFALGAFLGTRVGPLLLSDGKSSPYAPLFGLAGALLAGAVLASGFEGIGSRLRRGLRVAPGARTLDGLLGAVLMACVGLGLAWVAGAVALQTPGARHLRRDVQRSVILAHLNAALPSRDLLNALARFDPFPRISGVGIDVAPPPPAGIGRDPQVRAASRSVVKILGTACGLGVEGSGWVAAPGIVVTNAHVIAGEKDTTVLREGREPGSPATAVHFDARNDVAILRVPGLDAPALRLASGPREGAGAAILGFPLDGPYRVRPARLGSTRRVITRDAYGSGPVRRPITALRGKVQSGNSGGPVVNRAGRVVTTIFAATTGGTRGGFGVPNATVRRALRDSSGAVSTGPCAG
jgi:S1-C subfamily serine protease